MSDWKWLGDQGKGGRFWHWNPSDRVASRFAGSLQAERIFSQTHRPFSVLIEGIFYSSAENMLMKYKSFSLISGLPLLPICALTDGWAIEAAENQNKRGECWDFGGGGGLKCNFIKQGCVTGCLKEWKVFLKNPQKEKKSFTLLLIWWFGI